MRSSTGRAVGRRCDSVPPHMAMQSPEHQLHPPSSTPVVRVGVFNPAATNDSRAFFDDMSIGALLARTGLIMQIDCSSAVL